MVWLYPSFFWAFFVLFIPLIIHLFNFRRYKKLVFPNLRMLKQIQHQTKSGNQLKKILILISRLLAFSFLVLAFAQPIKLHKNQALKNGRKYISLSIDNSFSMNLNGSEGPLLEAAKKRARAIINASGNGDEFNIVSSDLDAALLHFTGKEAALNNIDKINISAMAYPLQNRLELQKSSLLKKAGDLYAYTISDFQTTNSQVRTEAFDSSIVQTWIKIPSLQTDNISIDSCYLLSPILQAQQPIVLKARVSNYTKEKIESQSLELWVDGKPKGVANYEIEPYSNATQDISFTLDHGGLHRCELRLSGDQIPLDDKLYFSLRINENYRVVNICKPDEKYVDAVFSDNPGYIYRKENSGNINFSDFKKRDLIVLQGLTDIQSGLVSELKKFVQNGGSVLVFPAKDIPYGGLQPLANEFGFRIGERVSQVLIKVSSIDLEHPIFKTIFENKPGKTDLPTVSQYYAYQFNAGNSILRLANMHAFVHDLPVGKGRLFLVASPLDPAYSNFQNHALFVPIALRAAMLAQYRNPLYYISHDAEDLYTGLPYETETGISLKGEQLALVPELINKNGDLYLNTHGEIEKPGHYQLMRNGQDTGMALLTFNSSRQESDTRCLNDQRFENLCDSLGVLHFEGSAESLNSQLNKIQKGSPLWKWCIIFSLICLLIEILLIRFFRSHVSTSS